MEEEEAAMGRKRTEGKRMNACNCVCREVGVDLRRVGWRRKDKITTHCMGSTNCIAVDV